MRGDRQRLEDILEASRLIRERLSGRSSELAQDPILQAAAERLIEIIGEAAANLSSELREAYPDVLWRGPIGIRNILAHRYFGIDIDVVREVVEHDIPALEQQVREILDELGDAV